MFYVSLPNLWNTFEEEGLTEKFCKEESLAAVKQVPSFIDNTPAYRDESRHSAIAIQFSGLKMSNILVSLGGLFNG